MGIAHLCSITPGSSGGSIGQGELGWGHMSGTPVLTVSWLLSSSPCHVWWSWMTRMGSGHPGDWAMLGTVGARKYLFTQPVHMTGLGYHTAQWLQVGWTSMVAGLPQSDHSKKSTWKMQSFLWPSLRNPRMSLLSHFIGQENPRASTDSRLV